LCSPPIHATYLAHLDHEMDYVNKYSGEMVWSIERWFQSFVRNSLSES
jgi:hypothetical protein